MEWQNKHEVLDADTMRSRVLDAFATSSREWPRWLNGVVKSPWTDDPNVHLAVILDAGMFPVRLLASVDQLHKEVHLYPETEYLYLVIHPDYGPERIVDKCVGFFERERRIRTGNLQKRMRRRNR